MSDSQLHILGVGAHPDDLEFGCGGILLAEAARGSEISLCICSRGEAGSNGAPNEREAEARSAAQILGAKIDFLEMGGAAHLEIYAVNNIAIARQIRTARPDVLLASGFAGSASDHIVVSHLCRNAVRTCALRRFGRAAQHPLGRTGSGVTWNTRSHQARSPAASNA
jgi:LmbE family N-acetylglucosaminyl deacetylase